VNKGISEKKVFATGIPLSNRFFLDYDKDALLNDFDLSKDKFTILFFAGGRFGLGKKNTYKILEDIARYMDNVQVVAIAGKNKKMFDAFNDTVKKYKRKDDIKVLEFTDKVPELMHISNIVITKPGGLTTTEAGTINIPIIHTMPIPGCENYNADFFATRGMSKRCNTIEEICAETQNLINNENLRNKMIENQKKYIDKQTCTKICNLIINECNKNI